MIEEADTVRCPACLKPSGHKGDRRNCWRLLRCARCGTALEMRMMLPRGRPLFDEFSDPFGLERASPERIAELTAPAC
jgi:DNA-directed RNA polymerase subunit RPC12/RpoP